jgi:hypothetical protein
MNQVAPVGNITDDPELRYTQSGAALAGFTVAGWDFVQGSSQLGALGAPTCAPTLAVSPLDRGEQKTLHEHLLVRQVPFHVCTYSQQHLLLTAELPSILAGRLGFQRGGSSVGRAPALQEDRADRCAQSPCRAQWQERKAAN